jgi:hypothetical protein
MTKTLGIFEILFCKTREIYETKALQSLRLHSSWISAASSSNFSTFQRSSLPPSSRPVSHIANIINNTQDKCAYWISHCYKSLKYICMRPVRLRKQKYVYFSIQENDLTMRNSDLILLSCAGKKSRTFDHRLSVFLPCRLTLVSTLTLFVSVIQNTIRYSLGTCEGKSNAAILP